MESLLELTNALSNGAIPDPLRPPLPQDCGQPPPKTPIAIISGTDEATDFKFGLNVHRVHSNKSPIKFSEKIERGRIQGLSNFLGTPKLSQEWVKLRTSNLASTFTGSIRTKAHYKYGEKGALAYPGTAQFFG